MDLSYIRQDASLGHSGHPRWYLSDAGKTVAFSLPNPAALYLSLASATRDEAASRRNAVFGALRDMPNIPHPVPRDEDEAPLFDCLERLAACVVFSHLAIEAFANERLPRDFQYPRERSDGRCKEVYDRQQVERWISLDEKLDRILPQIHSVASPKGSSVWAGYRWLTSLRDRCVHLKEGDWNGREPTQAAESVWSALLRDRTLEAPEVAASLIGHFYSVEVPRWIQHLGRRVTRGAPAGKVA